VTARSVLTDKLPKNFRKTSENLPKLPDFWVASFFDIPLQRNSKKSRLAPAIIINQCRIRSDDNKQSKIMAKKNNYAALEQLHAAHYGNKKASSSGKLYWNF